MRDEVKENIYDLSKKNAKFIKFISNEDFQNSNLEHENIYIKFNKNKTIEYNNTNNYLRKDIFLNVLNNKIVPILDLKNDIIININFHDSYDFSGILSFGAKNNNTKSVLIPDMYQMNNYVDSIPSTYNDKYVNFTDKINKIIFCGASSGSIDIKYNDRINTCIWSNKNSWAKEYTNFKITSIVQLSNTILNNYTTLNNIPLKNILSNSISIEEQLKYKYILSIDGNTWAWDRPVWIMNSNSLFLKYESENIGWYYEFLKENKHYVSVNRNNMENKYNFFENNTNQALEIIKNSKKFVKDYCSEEAWTFYFKSLLDEISELNI
jgi:hypothetical protein